MDSSTDTLRDRSPHIFATLERVAEERSTLCEVLDRHTPAVKRVDFSRIPIRLIQECVARHFGMSCERLLTRRRLAELAEPRQIAMYLCRELTEASLPAIATAFGKRDHTTVMYARDKVKGRIAADPFYADIVAALRESVLAVHAELREKHLSDNTIRRLLKAV